MKLSLSILLCLGLIACGDDSPTSNSGTDSSSSQELLSNSSEENTSSESNQNSDDFPFNRFTSNVTIYEDGDEYVIETDDLPNHSSPYWGSGHDLYSTPHSGMVVNPNEITAQDLSFRIPKNPSVNSTTTETELGPIGVSINGVVFFNAYAGKDRTTGEWLGVEDEIPTFDEFQGHPAQAGLYHYHLEPLYLTQDDASKFLGFLKDGFPVYGKIEQDGTNPSELDECHGHSHVTEEYPEGSYHYHMSESFPYLHDCYRGTPGK